jgi:glutaredoxin 3
MKKITVYTKTVCPYCDYAKGLLKSKNLPYTEINVETDYPGGKEALVAKTGWQTVPQVFFDDELIGGFTELNALNQSGQLDSKLA